MKYSTGFIYMLILANIILSGYTYFSGVYGNDFLCITGKACENVQNSIFGDIFGIKVSLFGFLAFIVLFIAYYMVKKENLRYEIFAFMSLVGAGFALYFISLQVFVLKELCSDCFSVDVIMIIIFIASLFELNGTRKIRR